MKRIKKIAALTCAATLSVVALAGCSTSNPGSTGGSSGGVAATGTINVLDWDGTTPAVADLFTKAKAAFESQYSGWTVNIQNIDNADYYTKLLTMMAAGSPPDVYQLSESDVANYWGQGLLADITPFANGSNPMSLDGFYPSVKNVFTIDGKMPVVATSMATYAVYYNKDLFDAAGIAYPTAGWTWADFEKAAKQLTITQNGKITQFGAALTPKSDDIEPLINAMGGSILSPDGKTATGYLDSAKTVAAVKYYTDLAQAVSPTVDDQTALGSAGSILTTGKVAMDVDGPWPLSTYQADKSLNFGVVEMPSYAGEAGTDWIYAGAYGIAAKSPNQQMAWNFIKIMSDPTTDIGKMWAQFGLPATQALGKDPTYSAPEYAPFLSELNTGIIKSAYLQNPYFRAAQNQYLNPALLTLASPPGGDVQSALTQAAQQMDTYFTQQSG